MIRDIPYDQWTYEEKLEHLNLSMPSDYEEGKVTAASIIGVDPMHEMKNQNGNHIINDAMRVEINHALENDLDHTYYEGTKIEIVKDFKTDKLRETVVNVEGL
jgi:hypothetical protein